MSANSEQRIALVRDALTAHDRGELTSDAALVAMSMAILLREPTQAEKDYAMTLERVNPDAD